MKFCLLLAAWFCALVHIAFAQQSPKTTSNLPSVKLSPTEEELQRRVTPKINKLDFRGALNEVNIMLAGDSTNITLYNVRATLHTQMFDFPATVKDFDHIIALQPNNLYALQSRAQVRREHLRDNNGALHDWTRVLAIDSLNAAAYFARAEILREQEKFQEAHSDYAACLRTGNPDNVTALTARGFCAMKLKRVSEAMTDFTAAISMTDSASGRSIAGFDAWFYRGSLHLQRRKFKEAVFDFDAALRLNDQSGEAYYLRGYAKMLGGNTQDGCIDVAQANELHYAAAKGLIEQHCDAVPNLDSLRRYTMPTVTVTAGRSPAEIAMTDSRRLLGRVQSLVANPTATQQYGISQINIPAFRSPPGMMSPFDCNKQRLEMTRPSQINLGCVAQILQEELRKVRDPQIQAMVNNIMDTANDLYVMETPMQDASSSSGGTSVSDINAQQIQLVRIRLADQFRELNTYLARRQESLKASSK